MTPSEPNSSADALSIAHLREQITLLMSVSHQLLGGQPQVSGSTGADASGAVAQPGPADLKRLLRLRAARRRDPKGSFFEWPAWDMLLDLAAVGAEGGHVSVSAICVSSGAPQSTAFRKLAQLEQAGLVRRYLHDTDRRSVCLALTNPAYELVNKRITEDFLFYGELSNASERRRVTPLQGGRPPAEPGQNNVNVDLSAVSTPWGSESPSPKRRKRMLTAALHDARRLA